jgi:hypothetical protein
MRIQEQVDRTGDNLTYSWLLEAPYTMRNKLSGWKWLKGHGCKGCYVTNDKELAIHTAGQYKCRIISNGTHQRSGAPMLLATDDRAAA